MTVENLKEIEKIMRDLEKLINRINSHSEKDREKILGMVLMELLDKVEASNGYKIGVVFFALQNYVNAVSGKQASEVLLSAIAHSVNKIK